MRVNIITSYLNVVEIKEVVGHPVKFEGFENFNFFAHKNRYSWEVREFSTGLSITWHPKSKSLAIEQAKETLIQYGAENLKKVIQSKKIIN